MSLDRYPELDPDDGELLDTEVAVTDDALVKAFALGPGAELNPHVHEESINVFHVTEGTVTVVQEGTREKIDAPGVVVNERGVSHGVENESDERAVVTATLAPFPG